MSLSIIAFTRQGRELACRIADLLGMGNVYVPERLCSAHCTAYGNLSQWTKERFYQKEDMVFVSATGIAVRAIAPFVQDKLSDPAVVSVDELGRFAVPLLSGHVGGANRLAQKVADVLGGTAVISTATDLYQTFAVDRWAAEHGMEITDKQAAKMISSALLEGKKVTFQSELPCQREPQSVQRGTEAPGFAVTCRRDECFDAGILVLHPRLLTVGVGCRTGLPQEQVWNTAERVLKECGFSTKSVCCVASIDLKREDAGIRFLAEQWGVTARFYTAAELSAAPGSFTPSSFVRSVTGVDNVCERSAVLAAEGGELLVRKIAESGVTVAIAQKNCIISFREGVRM